MSLTLDAQIQHLRPETVANSDYILQDDGDGAYIAQWITTKSIQPTQAELDAIDDAAVQGQNERRAALQATDAEMVRIVEDIYAVLTPDQKAALPAEAVNKINARQSLRTTGIAGKDLPRGPRKNGKK